MKAEFERRYSVACQKWESLSEAEQEGTKKPAQVQIRTALAKEFWLLESEEAQARFTREAEAEYQMQTEKWEALQKVPVTPQSFHQ